MGDLLLASACGGGTLGAARTTLVGPSAPQPYDFRSTFTPTPRQQGVDEPEASTGSPRWSLARLLKRVFDLAMATCPLYHQGALRLIAAPTPGEVIRKILRPLQLAADPPPMAPARCRQEAFAWVSA